MKRAVTFLAALALGAAACARQPADDSADAGFARDMATHHAQAVEMGFIIRDASEDAPLRSFAADIIVTQSAQRGMFMAWLQGWGLPQATTGSRMAWMPASASGTHAGHGDTTGMPIMMGTASDAELRALRDARGRDAEVLFLQLMIRHHEGGVLMARAVLPLSSRDEVVTMAKSIESGQRGEIAVMTEMLSARSAAPYASLLK